MKKLVNIGIIGCADIAERFIVPTLLGLADNFHITGFASRTKDKANNFLNKFGIKDYNSYENLLDEKQLDALYIPLPNSLHSEWIETALNKNLHVLVEKSMACNLADVLRLNHIAADKNLVLVENFQFRFHKQLFELKNIVSNGDIGELRCVRSSFGFPPFPNKENIRYIKELGGGALYDAGAYPIKISQIFLGQDIEVSSANLWYDDEKNVDIWGGAYLRQKEGPLFAEIAFGFDNYYQCNLELWGSKGKVSANRIFTSPPGAKAEIVLESNNGKKVITIDADDHFKNMLIYFYELIISKMGRISEYEQNINQSRLLQDLNIKANEK